MSLNLQANMLVCLLFVDAGRSYDTLGSATKDFIIHGNCSSNSTRIFLCQFPSSNPTGCCEEGQVIWALWVGFVTGMLILGSLSQASPKEKLPLPWFTRNVKAQEAHGEFLLTWNYRFGNSFQVQMIELLLQVKTVFCGKNTSKIETKKLEVLY